MATDIRRPTSVWVAQILLFFFALIFGALLVVTVPAIMNRGAETSLIGLVLAVAVNIVIIVLCVIAFWGMFRRRSYGRWLGFGVLLLTFVLSIAGQFLRPQGPLESVENNNSPSASGFVGMALIGVLFLALLYQLARGKRVIAFFAPDEPSADVPPPPSFEA